MSTFDDCLAFLLRPDIEGGNVDNPHDPGGRTRKGVTQKTYDAWRHKQNLPQQDVFAMSDAECADIYREEYWTPSHCEALEPPIALYVFDMSVNMGIGHSFETLQRALGIVADGIFGPQTLAAVSAAKDADLTFKVHGEREKYYRSLGNFDRFGNGWLARNDKCFDTAMSWITTGGSS